MAALALGPRSALLLACVLGASGWSVSEAQTIVTVKVDGTLTTAELPWGERVIFDGPLPDSVRAEDVKGWLYVVESEEPTVTHIPSPSNARIRRQGAHPELEQWVFEGEVEAVGRRYIVQSPSLRADRYYQFLLWFERGPNPAERRRFVQSATQAADAVLRRYGTAGVAAPDSTEEQTLAATLSRAIRGVAREGEMVDLSRSSLASDERFAAETFPLVAPYVERAAALAAANRDFPSRADEARLALEALRQDPALLAAFDLVSERPDPQDAGAYRQLVPFRDVLAALAEPEALGIAGDLAVRTTLYRDMAFGQRGLGRDVAAQRLPKELRGCSRRDDPQSVCIGSVQAGAELAPYVLNLTSTSSLLDRLGQVLQARAPSQALARRGVDAAQLSAAIAGSREARDRVDVAAEVLTIATDELNEKQTELNKVIKSIETSYQQGVRVLGMTRLTFKTRAARYLQADLGVLYAGQEVGVHPALTTHVYPFGAPPRDAGVAFWPWNWKLNRIPNRFTIHAGVTVTSVAREGRRDNLVSTFGGVVGGGFLLNENVKLLGGALLFYDVNPDPFVTGRDGIVGVPYVSLSFPLDLEDLLGGITKLF